MASPCPGLTKFVLAKTQNHVQIHQRDKQQQQEVHRKAGRKEGRINILGSNIQIEVDIKVRIFNDFSSPWQIHQFTCKTTKWINNNNNNSNCTKWKEGRKLSHTWVGDGDDTSPAEVAIPIVPPRLLVVSIERIRGMR